MSAKASPVAESLAILRKDLLCEYRSPAAASAVLLFAGCTLAIVSFSIGPFGFEKSERPFVHAVLLWVVLLFSATAGLPRSFAREEDEGTSLALRLTANPGALYAGKVLGNLLVVLVLEILLVPAFHVLLGLEVKSWPLLVSTLLAGAVALAGATTLIAAVAAKTASRGTLFSVLAFPILIPLLLAAVSATRNALDSDDFAGGSDPLRVVVSFAGAVTVAGVLLFPAIWRE